MKTLKCAIVLIALGIAAGVKFRRDDIVSGPGGSQIWVVDPSGNLVELFQPK